MGGTIVTEEAEFEEIYKIKAVEIPTNEPVIRKDHDDEVYLLAKDKYLAVINLVRECQERKQPILIGTTSIEKSELFSSMLDKEKIKHQILNARHHDKEALIIANAGRLGTITIATNMAGRGTDIRLGGNWEIRAQVELEGVEDEEKREEMIEKIKREVEEEQKLVKAAGGLFVIGTERHESRRIDNQLRGRSGRQGDEGASKFFISLEDDLMRIFGSGKIDVMMRRAGMKEGEAISHKWISKAIERAQKKVEAHNFEIRKHLLKYDDVMSDQRKVIYAQRLELIQSDDISDLMREIRADTLNEMISESIPNDSVPDYWNFEEIHSSFSDVFNIEIPIEELKKNEALTPSDIRVIIEELVAKQVETQENEIPAEILRQFEKNSLLRIVDHHWKDHLHNLDYLRQGIGLRAYAQSNPLNEYKRESFNMFSGMMQVIKREALRTISHFSTSQMETIENFLRLFGEIDPSDFINPEESEDDGDNNDDSGDNEVPSFNLPTADSPPPSRNAPCPCGSGKRYKHCHGALS
jgi:preprotein translocase subunit SecA